MASSCLVHADPNGTTVQRPQLPSKPVSAKPTVGGNTVVTIIPSKQPHTGAFVAQLDVTPGSIIPIGFLGTSHEWWVWACYYKADTAA
jgi:hypothetical protein